MRRPIALLLIVSLAPPIAAQTPLIERGKASLRHGEYDAAASLFRQAVAESPDSAEAHYWLGVAYGREARKAIMFRQMRLAVKTREEFERAVQLDPGELRARFGLVQFYTLAPIFIGGGDRKAFPQAREIARRDPSLGHEALAFIYADEKRYREAFEELEQSVSVNSQNMPAWFAMGRLAAVTGTNLARGEEALQKYVASTPNPDNDDPPLARAFYWLGMIYEKRGRTDEARQSYAASLRLDPSQKDVREAMALHAERR